ncbi:MAG: hypothetical protein DWQ07_01780 [Chloroflexi bacterium]|nr:MAG: hypothetical protein DWQ07_01780 [Chloroflexota bacterium]MBL1193772.1 hypothetical protein [Chloroflexota bacterium]NOH11065.1 hypothetical protein [Chloroflexota bacterium]
MKGDVIIIEEQHRQAAGKIVPHLLQKISAKTERYTISVGGESGSGKSETGHAIAEELRKHGIQAIVLGQDDYFVLPPKSNDAKRREDPTWLGPHIEVKLELLNQHLKDAIAGNEKLTKPLIDYDQNLIEEEEIDLHNIKVIVAEGTYTSLLKNVETKVFITRNRLDTLEHRIKRNRGSEASDPFIEQILELEHKIIAGHKNLADFIITKDYDVIVVE